MKLTSALFRQHLGFMFKKHWIVQGKRVPIKTGVEEHLKALGIEVVDANKFVEEKVERQRVEIVGIYTKPPPLDENHPNYLERPCHMLEYNNVLLEGIRQAQVLTNTLRIDNYLPDEIEELSPINLPESVNEYVKNAIMTANIFDAEMKKLPKIKDPKRPAYNFPRILGISDRRRNTIMANKLLNIIERLHSDKPKFIVNDVESVFTAEKDNDLLQFKKRSDTLIASSLPLKYTVNIPKEKLINIPDLHPIKHTVTMPPNHFYQLENIHPLGNNVKMSHPHTTWLHFNASEVSNIFETPVTPEQMLGRSLTHCFTVAAAYAKAKFGDVQDLPEPVFLNCVQTDGQSFHLGVLQLNTLNLNSDNAIKNYWFSKNNLKMYDSCQYVKGVPMLDTYYPEVMKYLSAFCYY